MEKIKKLLLFIIISRAGDAGVAAQHRISSSMMRAGNLIKRAKSCSSLLSFAMFDRSLQTTTCLGLVSITNHRGSFNKPFRMGYLSAHSFQLVRNHGGHSHGESRKSGEGHDRNEENEGDGQDKV